jgi:hypothetical protein
MAGTVKRSAIFFHGQFSVGYCPNLNAVVFTNPWARIVSGRVSKISATQPTSAGCLYPEIGFM